MIKYLLALKYIIFLFIKYKFYRSGKKRYFSIFLQILKNKPIYICEVGVYTGERSNEIIKLAIKRMIPSGPLGKKQLSNCKIYLGENHLHEAQQPKIVDFIKLNAKNFKR